MLVINESAADRPDLQDAYFDGSLELLRELAVTNNVDAALPRLSAIVSKMLPHDALRMACFDPHARTGRELRGPPTCQTYSVRRRGRDRRLRICAPGAPGASAGPHATERLVALGFRSFLGVSTRAPEPLVRVAFWSKRPMAFNHTHVPLARRIASASASAHARASGATRSIRSDNERGRSGRRGRAARRRSPGGGRTCRSWVNRPSGAGCCARRRRSPRRTPPC